MTHLKSNIPLTNQASEGGGGSHAAVTEQAGAEGAHGAAQPAATKDPIDRLSSRMKAAKAKAPKEEPAQGGQGAGEAVAGTEKGAATTEGAKGEGATAGTPAGTESGFKKQSFTLKEKAAAAAAEGTGKGAAEATPAAEGNLTAAEKEELLQLRTILNKPSVKVVLKAEESGKSFMESYDEMRSRDPKKMTYDQLREAQLKEMSLTQEEIDRRMTKFRALEDEDDKLEMVAPYRKTLEERFAQEIQDFSPKFNAPQEQVDPWKDLRDPYQATAKTYVEGKKEILGIAVTPELAQATVDFYNSGSLIDLTEGGGLEPEDLFKKTFTLLNLDLIINQAREVAYNDGVKFAEAKNGVGTALPSQNGTGAQPSQQNGDEKNKNRVHNLLASLPK